MLRPTVSIAALLLFAAPACENGSSSSATPGRGDSASPPTAASTAEEAKTPPVAVAPEYRGTGHEGALVARLYGAGDRVTGTYFYESDGLARILSGTAKGTHLVLEETLDGVKSGTLTLDAAPSGALSGTWTDAHGGNPSPIAFNVLTPTAQPSTLLFKRTTRKSHAVRDAKSVEDVCKATLSYPEVYGLPPTVEAKINADLGPTPDLALVEKCEHAIDVVSDYRVAHDADGILSVRLTSSVKDASTSATTHGGRAISVLLATGLPIKLFGEVVKPKAERTFETALGEQVAALAQRNNLGTNGRKALDQALAFSPPFVLEEKGVHLFADTLPPTYAAAGAEGVVVRYANLPRPVGPVAVLWGK